VWVRDFPQDPVAPSLVGRRTDDIVVPSSQSVPQVVFVALVCVLELGKGQVLVLGTFRVPWVRDGRRRWRKRSLGLFIHDRQDGRGFDVCSSLCSGSLCNTRSFSSDTKPGRLYASLYLHPQCKACLSVVIDVLVTLGAMKGRPNREAHHQGGS
jgi:hypothetical protein